MSLVPKKDSRVSFHSQPDKTNHEQECRNIQAQEMIGNPAHNSQEVQGEKARKQSYPVQVAKSAAGAHDKPDRVAPRKLDLLHKC